jgi:hypothetical protein
MLAKFILSELNDTSKWRLDEHTIKHIKSGQELWIANGEKYIDTWPKSHCFTDVEKKAIWEKFKSLRDKLREAERISNSKDLIKAWGITGDEKITEDGKEDTQPKTSKISNFLKKLKIKVVYK